MTRVGVNMINNHISQDYKFKTVGEEQLSTLLQDNSWPRNGTTEETNASRLYINRNIIRKAEFLSIPAAKSGIAIRSIFGRGYPMPK